MRESVLDRPLDPAIAALLTPAQAGWLGGF
jgi:hypothetical protein